MTTMVTICPSCRQQLAVTPADLRVGQGFVRCGRCDKVFNALLTLAEDAPVPVEPDSVAHGTGSMPALDEQDVLPPLPGRENDPEEFTLDDDVEVVQTHVTGQYRSLVMEGEDLQLAEAADPRSDQDEADERELVAREIIRQATSQPLDMVLDEEPREQQEPREQRQSRPAAATPPPAPQYDEAFDADEAVGNAPRAGRGWYAAAVLLALVLAGQYVHLNRHTLVTVPWLERPIGFVYGRLGETVEPPFDLAHYEVPGLGPMELAADAATLVLPAAVAVRKEAPWGQPPPLIRAVLSDQYGNVLATHDLAPGDWLLGEAPARIAPGGRLDARLSMPATARATGFALFPCLHDSGGSLHCTDKPTR